MSHTTKSRYVHLEIALPIDLAHILACYKDIVEEETDPREGIGYLIGYWVNTQHNAPYDPEDDSCTLCRHALEHEVEHPNDQLTAALVAAVYRLAAQILQTSTTEKENTK